MADTWEERVSEFFPHIIDRAVPFVREGTPMLLAASLLRYEQIDALPVVKKEEMYPMFLRNQENKPLALSGYSIIASLVQEASLLNSTGRKYLFQSCEDKAIRLAEVSFQETLDGLLNEFFITKFGFAIVVVSETPYSAAFISLQDILQMYSKTDIPDEMTAGEIASPLFSLPDSVSLKATLEQMLEHGVRRVIVEDGARKKVVTEREIISWIFSPKNLVQSMDKFPLQLSTSLGEIENSEVSYIEDDMNVKDIATFLTKNKNLKSPGCLLCGKGIITYWDVVMKPWLKFKPRVIQ